MIESLEPRKLLSASLKGGLLSVRGTPSDDYINVLGRANRIIVNVNGHQTRFPSASVSSIRIDARAGDDRVDARNLRPNNTVLGGAGNDLLLGSSHSQLAGGGGDNKLRTTDRFIINVVNPIPGIILPPPIIFPFTESIVIPPIVIPNPNIISNPNIFPVSPPTLAPPGYVPPAPTAQLPASPSASLNDSNSELLILGSDASDNIVLEQTDDSIIVHLDGETLTFDLSSVSRVRIQTFGGDDLVDASALSRDVVLVGGDGNDTLIGGAGIDQLFGEAGQDELHGGDNTDLLVGGPDSDQFFGDAGDDVLNSIDGLDDTLHGGDGTDSNDTYADTADSIEIRPLPPQAVCVCININGGAIVGSGSAIINTGSLIIENTTPPRTIFPSPVPGLIEYATPSQTGDYVLIDYTSGIPFSPRTTSPTNSLISDSSLPADPPAADPPVVDILPDDSPLP